MNRTTARHPDLSFWETAAQADVSHIPLAYTSNLGDDIQAAAACRWFNVSRLVDRDAAETWPAGATVPLVGWWNRGRALLPPGNVDFIIIGFHLQQERRRLLHSAAVRERLKEAVRRQGFPAGCRDLTTWKLLRDAGIPAVFAGCVTQTLPSYTGPREGRLAVDVTPEPGEQWTTHHRQYLRELPPSARLIEANKAIARYASLERLRTIRLHAYLPAIAQGTRSILQPGIRQSDRFAGLVP